MAHVRLAQADAKEGKFQRAASRFKWLLLNDTDSAQRSKTYQEALRQLTERAPLTFKAAGALLPSTNVGRRSSEPFQIGDLIAQKVPIEDGLGVRVEASSTYTQAYQAGREASVTLRFNSSLYDAVELRYSGVDLSLTHRWLTPGTTYTVSAFAGRSIYPSVDDRTSPNSWVQGVALQAAYVLDNGHVARVSGVLSDRTFDDTKRAYSTGTTASVSTSYTFPVSERGKITILGGLTTANVGSESFSYSGHRLGVTYSRSHANGLSWSLGYSTSLRGYDEIYPLFSFARSDMLETVSASLSHKRIQINGVTPHLSCASKHQTSNISLYQYSSVDCALKFQLDF